MTQPVISLRNVGIAFRRSGGPDRRHEPVKGRRLRTWGLRNVSLDVAAGEVMGLVGSNGAGKTTLLRVVAGIIRPTEGEVVVDGRVNSLLSFSAGLRNGLSGWDNIELGAVLLGASRRHARSLSREVAEFSGLGEFLDAPVRVYSTGMKARLGFALAVSVEPDLLLIDEGLSAGDREFRERAAARLLELIQAGRAVMMASHSLDPLVDRCDRLAWLEEGRLMEIGEPGPVSARYVAGAQPAAGQPLETGS